MHQWYLFILWIIESTNEIIFSLMNSLVRWRLDGNAWPAWTVTTVLFRTTLTRTIMLNLLTPGFKPFIVKPVLIGHPRDSRDCWTGPSCSNVGQRYSPDKSLSGGYVLGVYPVDRVIQFSNNSFLNVHMSGPREHFVGRKQSRGQLFKDALRVSYPPLQLR